MVPEVVAQKVLLEVAIEVEPRGELLEVGVEVLEHLEEKV